MIKKILVLIIPLLFLVVGIATISDYGVNWDEPLHFMRGQAYFHFFVTGEKNYSNLSPYPRLSNDCPLWAKGYCDVSPRGAIDVLPSTGKGLVYEDAIKSLYPQGKTWRSFFQHDLYDYDEVIKSDSGHPPLNGILAALTNNVFFQKIHLFGDIESYHLFEVLVSFVLVFGVSIFVYRHLGIFASIVASFSLASYPLFFSESHFNIKDPVEAAFFGLTIILFYFGIIKNNWKLIIASAVICAFALGTKFNALFLAPILGTWLLFYLITLLKTKGRKIVSKQNIKKILPLIISLIFFPIITFAIFYALWPYLWSDPLNNILAIVKYYKQIGLGTLPELSKYLINGWNTYPITWIIYTTPIPILILTGIGAATSFFLSLFKKNHFLFLILVWFLVPLLRVSLPKTIIYGGIRQIMEFIPAMAILTGVGAWILIKMATNLNKKILPKLVIVAIVVSLVFVTYEMVRIHPNQNVYFNQLIGGLSGAKEQNIPNWGNSYGNAYQQGVNWLNENAEPNAKLVFPVATMGNIPRIKLRSDIDLNNRNWSGLERKGEYGIELNYNWNLVDMYTYAYYDKYLYPVFEAKVDGVSILKVWKNDLEHTKSDFKKEVTFIPSKIEFENNLSNNELLIDFGEEVYLTKLMIKHSAVNCKTLSDGYILLSSDELNWQRVVDALYLEQVPQGEVIQNGKIFFFKFAAIKSRYLMLNPIFENPCIFKNPQIILSKLDV